ncbi:MAG: hypothetical protein AAF467_13455 [Actinomycetota bacterium]
MTRSGAHDPTTGLAPGAWWVVDPSRPDGRAPALVATSDGANDLLAAPELPRYLVFWPATTSTDVPEVPDVAATVAMLDLAPDVALHVSIEGGATTGTAAPATATPLVADAAWPSADAFAARLVGSAAAEGDGSGPASVIVARAASICRAGGFDPAFHGLGWIDVVARISGDGLVVTGVDPAAVPFLTTLDGTLDPRAGAANVARWWRRHVAARPGEGGLDRFRALVLAATHIARTGDASSMATDDNQLAGIAADAQAYWRDPAPHESQVGVGHRADWRALLPHARYGTVCILDGSEADQWQWLVDDGWAERVVTDPVDGHNAEVIVRAGGAVDLPRAASLLNPTGTLCVLGVDRLPGVPMRSAGLRAQRQLRRQGFQTRRYLAVPDARQPRRFVPLDHPGGLDWFLSTGPEGGRHRISRRNRWRRRLVHRARAALPRLMGEVVLVATRSHGEPRSMIGLDAEMLGADVDDAIVITSGFDEGSRSVLLPLPSPGAPARPTEPSRVVKVAARPGYNANVDREHELLTSLVAQVGGRGPVPEPGSITTTGSLRASSESYAGRWTMTDVLNEQDDPADQRRLLDDVLACLSELGTRTGVNLEPWTIEHHRRLVADPLAAVGAATGRHELVEALIRTLDERATELVGVPVPFVGRHHDLGPWNVVVGADGPVLVDWELGPPRTFAPTSFAGADQLYLTRYWLHIVMACGSLDDELTAFPFLADRRTRRDARHQARDALALVASAVGLDRRFLPLVEAHVWAEAAQHTMRRRIDRGADPGSPGRYVLALARHRHRLMAHSR